MAPASRRGFEREYIGSAKNLSGFSNRAYGGGTVKFFAVLLITNYFVFFDSIGLTQRHFGRFWLNDYPTLRQTLDKFVSDEA